MGRFRTTPSYRDVVDRSPELEDYSFRPLGVTTKDRETLYGEAIQEEMDRVFGEEEDDRREYGTTLSEQIKELTRLLSPPFLSTNHPSVCDVCAKRRALLVKLLDEMPLRPLRGGDGLSPSLLAAAGFGPYSDKGEKITRKEDKLRADLIPWDVVDYVVDRKEDETDVGRALNDLFYRDISTVIKLTPETLRGAVGAFALGARKYGERSWEKGFSFKAIYAAGKRHLLAEEQNDPETGQAHYYNEVANLLILARFTRNLERYAQWDDRPRPFIEGV